MWQDYVFAAGGLTFAATLIPTIRNPQSEVPRSTSLLTTIMLLVFAYAHKTIGLDWAATANMLTATAWAFIFAYRPIREYPEIVQEVPQFEVTMEEAQLILAHREWMAEQERKRTSQPEAGCDGCPSQAPEGGPG